MKHVPGPYSSSITSVAVPLQHELTTLRQAASRYLRASFPPDASEPLLRMFNHYLTTQNMVDTNIENEPRSENTENSSNIATLLASPQGGSTKPTKDDVSSDIIQTVEAHFNDIKIKSEFSDECWVRAA